MNSHEDWDFREPAEVCPDYDMKVVELLPIERN